MLLSTTERDVYIREFYRSIGGSRALACWLMYSCGEHNQLAELEFDPHQYNDVDSARRALAATSLLSKAPFLQTHRDLKQVAMDKFRAAEEQCRETNRRINRGALSSDAWDALDSIRATCEKLLGEFSPSEWMTQCDWGPGATTTVKRRNATRAHKYSYERCISAPLFDLVKDWFTEQFPLWNPVFCIAGHSKIITVPKNAKTDRTIAIEPGINLYLQRGIGRMLRARLHRGGVDLKHQDRNANLARIGSKFDSLATVDFSSASDTVSRALVREVLPPRWFHVLDACRSHAGVIGKEVVFFEKFSSMGNGFTFELESMIFYALALFCKNRTHSDGPVSVYGDDVILPKRAYELYARVAGELGFAVNPLKSYAETPYRESCGAHWWNGVDVQPTFLKETAYDLHKTVKLANQVRLLAHRFSHHYGCDRAFRRLWETIRDRLPRDVPRVPPHLGDAGLISRSCERDVDIQQPREQGHEGFEVKAYVVVAKTRNCRSAGLLLHKLRLLEESVVEKLQGTALYLSIPVPDGQGNDVLLPLTHRTRVQRVRCLQWNDLGPWW